MRTLGFIAFILVGMLASGCSTTQEIKFTSVPQGAKVLVNGESKGMTPTKAELSRKTSHVVQISKEGFKTETVKIDRSPKYRLVPENVHVSLQPEQVEAFFTNGLQQQLKTLEDRETPLAIPSNEQPVVRPHVGAARTLPQFPEAEKAFDQETPEMWLLGRWKGLQVWSQGAGQRGAAVTVEFKNVNGTLVWELSEMFRGAGSKASGSAKVNGEWVTMEGTHVAGPAAGTFLSYTLARKGNVLKGTGIKSTNVPLKVSWSKVK